MKLAAEISLYPLQEAYIAPIKAFIERLNQYQSLTVKTSATSTLVVGEYETVMDVLAKEMRRTHEEVGQAIFVTKFLNADKAEIG